MSRETKTLKFTPKLIPLVLSGEKYATWRLWDEKIIEVGDELQLLNKSTLEQFGLAVVKRVTEKPLGELMAADKEGHEVFSSDEEMCATFAKYYHKPVGPETPVKIIWFGLVD